MSFTLGHLAHRCGGWLLSPAHSTSWLQIRQNQFYCSSQGPNHTSCH